MTLVYIHGASATGESFNYIREKLRGRDVVVNYDSRNGFQNNLESMKEQLKDVPDIFFIAHSLGGIYALHIANHYPEQVLGAVTLSTPYGGAEVADVVKYFLPFSRLMKDIGPSSWAMMQANRIKVQHPWTNVVTVRGQSPFMHEPNDGVVSIASQRYHADMELIDVEINHYEVVLNDSVIKIIRDRMRKVKEPA